MSARQRKQLVEDAVCERSRIAAAIRAAAVAGLIAGRQVKLGVVRGVVIGYNIARRGRFPGSRYPLLVKSELGIVKCDVHEVVPV